MPLPPPKDDPYEKALQAYWELKERAKKQREAEGHATPSLFYLEDGERRNDMRRSGHADTER